jgi:hypothetical protein
MNMIDYWWFISMLLQIFGAALTLGVLGLVYDAAIREKKSVMITLVESGREKWLTLGAMFFAIGLYFTRAGWGIKGIAIILTLVLMGITWNPVSRQVTYKAQIKLHKVTLKTITLLAGKAWLCVFLLLALAWGIHLGWHTYHLFRLAKNLQGEINQLQVDDIVPFVNSAADDISTIDGNLKPFYPIFSTLGGLPVIGPYLGQIDPLLTYADGIAQAGKEMLVGLEPLQNAAGEEKNDLSLLEHACQVLQVGQAHFIAASQSLEQASAVRNRIMPELLPDSIQLLFTQLDNRFNLLAAGNQLLQVASSLLGASQTQNYLVLAQNRDELRATGGFISGIGLLTIQHGKIQQFTLGDSYAVDDFTKAYPAPPEALKRFMLADYWVPRDANWSPDFPTTAQQVQGLYTLSTGIQTQGVIAFNQLAVQKVLEVIGPVQVPGPDEPITADNVENYMRQAWAPEPEEGLSQQWWSHRKDFMQQLGNVIIEKVLSSNQQDQLVSLAEGLVDLIGQGQLLIYFNDDSAQAALKKSGWDGSVGPGNGDYLFLVDSNVGFNKVDSVIKRSVSYQVDLSDLDHPAGKLTFTYQHTGIGNIPCTQEASYGNGTYQDMQQRCYWDYWRVYTPSGSELRSSTTQPVPSDELLSGESWPGQVESLSGEANTQVYAGMMVLPISKSTTISISYGLPASVLQVLGIDQTAYSLRINVQPGLQGLPFKLEIVLPSSVQISSPDVVLQAENANTWNWQSILDKPTELKFTLSRIH